MLLGTDYGDCRATLDPMMGALKHVLLEKRKEKLVRLKETKKVLSSSGFKILIFKPIGEESWEHHNI